MKPTTLTDPEAKAIVLKQRILEREIGEIKVKHYRLKLGRKDEK